MHACMDFSMNLPPDTCWPLDFSMMTFMMVVVFWASLKEDSQSTECLLGMVIVVC